MLERGKVWKAPRRKGEGGLKVAAKKPLPSSIITVTTSPSTIVSFFPHDFFRFDKK